MILFLNILLSFLIVAVIDYPGYNLTKHSKALLKTYRVFHGILVFGLGADLFLKHGIYVPFLFWFGCWCFNNDWKYYFIAWILNLKKKPFADEGRQTAEYYFTAPSVPHAWWTPVGLVLNFIDRDLPFNQREKPSAQALWAQSAFALIVIIYISFSL